MQKEKIEKICANCEFASQLGDSDACLCDKKGFVKARGVCRRFKADLLKIVPAPPLRPVSTDSEIYDF